MKKNFLIIFASLILVAQNLQSQKISLAATYTSTDAYFLENIPGIAIGYDYTLWKVNLFANASLGKQNHSYTESGEVPGYSVQIGNGTITKSGVDIGIGFNALSADYYRISLGAFFGLNYLHRQEVITNIYYEQGYPGELNEASIDDWYRNRPGYGLFLDVELAQVMIEQLSLFTKFEVGQTFLEEGSMPRGIPFLVWEYNSFAFSFGVRYSFIVKNASP